MEEFEPVQAGAVCGALRFVRRDKADGIGFFEVGGFLFCSDGDGVGIESEPSGCGEFECLFVPFVLIFESFFTDEPFVVDAKGEVKF